MSTGRSRISLEAQETGKVIVSELNSSIINIIHACFMMMQENGIEHRTFLFSFRQEEARLRAGEG